jgi:hypothetical protein
MKSDKKSFHTIKIIYATIGPFPNNTNELIPKEVLKKSTTTPRRNVGGWIISIFKQHCIWIRLIKGEIRIGTIKVIFRNYIRC